MITPVRASLRALITLGLTAAAAGLLMAITVGLVSTGVQKPLLGGVVVCGVVLAAWVIRRASRF